ncbi:MAG: class I SAM-dependent methyltransferase [Thermoleophilaceae bacterium]|nr:class I SAM-dependent methyltransferase [Thermoleophilaceae bacterium]
MADEVAWCQRHITPRHPNFLFERADVRNARYNPTGGALASEYSFPYAAGEFDFAFATSVFTHMLPDDVERYLAELGRVLKPSGRALLTWFLMTDRSRAALPTERFSFATQVGNASVNDPSSPEAAVAYPREWVERALDIAGLRAESVHPGGWCGTPDPPTWQDVMVVSRQSSSTLAGSS